MLAVSKYTHKKLPPALLVQVDWQSREKLVKILLSFSGYILMAEPVNRRG